MRAMSISAGYAMYLDALKRIKRCANVQLQCSQGGADTHPLAIVRGLCSGSKRRVTTAEFLTCLRKA